MWAHVCNILVTFHSLSPHLPALTYFSDPLPKCSLYEHSVPQWAFKITYSQCFDHLYVSALTTTYYKKKFKWSVTYVQQTIYLRGSLTTHPFIKTTRFSPRVYDLHSHEFLWGLQCQESINFYITGLKPNKKVVGYPIAIIPLLYKWAYLTQQVNFITCRSQGWIKSFLLQ